MMLKFQTVIAWGSLLFPLLASDALAQEPAATPAAAVTPIPATTVPTPVYLPQTRHERWHGYLHETLLGTMPAARIFGTAFLEHLGRQPVEWGLGAHGYIHRVENRIYSTAIDGTVHSSMAAALGQDTRYLPSEDRATMDRVAHALKRTFITRNQSGNSVPDVSGLAGIYAGTMLPMYWHPRRYSPLAQGVRAGNFGVMFQAGSNLLKEFQPDLKRLLAKRK